MPAKNQQASLCATMVPLFFIAFLFQGLLVAVVSTLIAYAILASVLKKKQSSAGGYGGGGYHPSVASQQPAFAPINVPRSAQQPATCAACGAPMAGKRCPSCGVSWCRNCGSWNVAAAERCGSCQFTIPP
nr:hypothetical protein [Candidatus Sigynarchaeota archaeon]